MFEIKVNKPHGSLFAEKSFKRSFDHDGEVYIGETEVEPVATYSAPSWNIHFTGGAEFRKEILTTKTPREARDVFVRWLMKFFTDNPVTFSEYLRELSIRERLIGKEEHKQEVKKVLGL